MQILEQIHQILLLLFFGCWLLGGWLLARRAFRWEPGEQALAGLALGLLVGTWLSNLLAQLLPLPHAFYASGLLLLSAGVLLNWPLDVRALWGELRAGWAGWLGLALMVYVFYAIGRGLAIFDDYQNLPVTSMLAAGDIPPHYSLDPALRFGYHYFLLLIAAQIVRVGDVFPWSALDLARALTLALTLALAAQWTYRRTGSRLAVLLAALLLAFAGGMRWVLLLLPAARLEQISRGLQLIGSGLQSGPDLRTALLSAWNIEGGGPLAFPFAFANSVNSPLVMAHSGFGVVWVLILVLLLMTHDRWTHWSAAVLSGVLLASLALANEVTFALLYAGALLVLLTAWAARRRIDLPGSLRTWLIVAAAAGITACLQGGMITEILRNRLFPVTSGASYYAVGFTLVFPPTLVSSHLGVLSLGNSAQLLAALLELGPVILVFPWVFAWGLRKLKEEAWFEAALAWAGVVSLLSVFVQYTGTGGITGTTRLIDVFLFACKVYAVPVLWALVGARSTALRSTAFALGAMALLSGVVMFATGLVAAGRPVHSYFLKDLDAVVADRYWNRLPAGALVFDPSPFRGPTVFGRGANAYNNWYAPKPEWEALVAAPDPRALRAAGFDYVYFDVWYWENLSPEYQAGLQDSCIVPLQRYEGTRDVDDYRKDFRVILDIRACD